MVLGPLLIKSWNETPVNRIVFLIWFYGSIIIYSIGMTGFFAATRNFGPGIFPISIGISVVDFAVFGFYQLWSGITA